MTTNEIPKSELERVINEDLYNDLRDLLIAEAAWKLLAPLAESDPIWERFPHHIQTTLSDSALLHGRGLLTFFTATKQQRLSDEQHLGVNWRNYASWGAGKQSSIWLKRWKLVLNARMFHISRIRPHVDDAEGLSHLNQQVSNLASEVLTCWDVFTNSITDQPIRSLLDEARTRALDEAAFAATRVREIMAR